MRRSTGRGSRRSPWDRAGRPATTSFPRPGGIRESAGRPRQTFRCPGLPGGQGIGTFDGAALRFLEFLQAAGMTWWQVCPLGPTGYGDSPYQCFSAFAGNPYLIDLQGLVAGGLLGADEIAPLASLGADSVDFGA